MVGSEKKWEVRNQTGKKAILEFLTRLIEQAAKVALPLLKTGLRMEEKERDRAKQPSRKSRDEEARLMATVITASGGGDDNNDDEDEANDRLCNPTKHIHTHYLRALRERNARLCSQDDLGDEGTF